MASADIFESLDYKDFLKKWLESAPRGSLSKLAESAGTQVSFLSQVTTKKVHLNHEQCWKIGKAMGLSDLEQSYFSNLLEFAKAQSGPYREHLRQELGRIANRRHSLKERFPVSDSLSEEQKSLYFSSYLYSAAHLLTTLEKGASKDRISEYLKIDLPTTSRVLIDLISMGLVEEKNARYRSRNKRIHLPSDSPIIIRHHTNWRLRSLAAIERLSSENLHYSSAVTISEKDAYRIKDMLIDLIGRFGELVKTSKAERCFVFNADFFEMESKC